MTNEEILKEYIEGIKAVLENEYNMSSLEAENVIRVLPMKNLINQNCDMVTHISCEKLAEKLHKLRKNVKNNA